MLAGCNNKFVSYIGSVSRFLVMTENDSGKIISSNHVNLVLLWVKKRLTIDHFLWGSQNRQDSGWLDLVIRMASGGLEAGSGDRPSAGGGATEHATTMAAEVMMMAPKILPPSVPPSLKVKGSRRKHPIGWARSRADFFAGTWDARGRICFLRFAVEAAAAGYAPSETADAQET